MDNKSTIPLYRQEYVSTLLSRIAELEASEIKLIEERDHAEDMLSEMYEAVTGEKPVWSNCFGFREAVLVVKYYYNCERFNQYPYPGKQ